MQSIAGLIDQVKTILIQSDGQRPRHEVYNQFINECKVLQLTEDDFYKQVLAPAAKSINWDAVEADRKNKAAAEQAAAQQASVNNIYQLIKTDFDSGVVLAIELNDIFQKAKAAAQDTDQIAAYINTQINQYLFKPYPAVNTDAPDAKARLLSANWYDEAHYKKLITPAAPVAPQPQPVPQSPQQKPPVRSGSSPLLKALLTALLVLVLVGGSLFYLLWWKPYIKEKNAPRMYSFANTISLRSSPVATGPQNVLQQVDYGTEMPVYEQRQDWSKVKVNNREGYVYNRYLLDKRSFYELNSIFQDSGTKNAIPKVKYRKALLDYFQQRNIIGKMDAALQRELFGSVPPKEVWQVAAREKPAKPNAIDYPVIRDTAGGLQTRGFAFLVINQATLQRRFVLYAFTATEEPQFVYEEEAPESGYILAVNRSYSGDNPYTVRYTH